MSAVFFIAGAPHRLFDSAKKQLERSLEGIRVLGFPINSRKNKVVYDATLANEITSSIIEIITTPSTSAKPRFLTILLVTHPNSALVLNQTKFAFINIGLPVSSIYLGDEVFEQNCYQVVRQLYQFYKQYRDHFDSRVASNSWLLPIENFKSDSLKMVLAAQTCLELSQIADLDFLALDGALNSETTVNPKRTVRVDDRSLVFVPSRRRDFHGHTVSRFAIPSFLCGNFRLGFSIPHGFHYDVRHKRWPNLDGLQFIDCEKGAIVCRANNTHVNITPNDRIRPGKK